MWSFRESGSGMEPASSDVVNSFDKGGNKSLNAAFFRAEQLFYLGDGDFKGHTL